MLTKVAAVAGAIVLAVIFAAAIWFLGGWPACRPITIGAAMKMAVCPSN